MNIGIIGGGLASVTLQHFLKTKSEILEKESRIGGLCRTIEKDGFLYDIGGHILFSKDNSLLEIIRNILGSNINYVKRNNKILFRNRYLKYPFENGLNALDKEDLLNCLLTYLNNTTPSPANFKQWLYYTFGSWIADNYLVPYNTKIWKTPPENMGIEWVQRIPKPPLEDILKSALGIETEGYLHQLYFNYPLVGGIESLVKALAENNSNITTDFEVRKITKKNHRWLVSSPNNEKIYDKLVLTIPVTDAVGMLPNVPQDVRNAAENLKFNSVRIVFIGLKNESLLDKSAVYIPDQATLFHRICFMGYFSKNTAPKGCSSLIAEITTNPATQHHHTSDAVLTEIVTSQLAKLNIIEKNQIVTTDVSNAKFGYVIYDTNYSKNITIVKDYFKSIGITLLGRFGQFEYINMDEVIKRSKLLASELNNTPGINK